MTGVKRQSKQAKQAIAKSVNTNNNINNVHVALKDVWQEFYNETYDCYYYYNRITRHTTWEQPQGWSHH